MAKPIKSLAAFQQIVLDRLPEDRQIPGLRTLDDQEISPGPLAYHDDMALIAEVLDGHPHEEKALDYVAQFLAGLAHSVDDRQLADAADRLAKARVEGGPVASNAANLVGLVHERLADRREI